MNKVIGAFLGTIVEYYDYSLYAFSVGVITQKFFPASDPVTSLMHFYAVYAVAYLAKPIGSLLFGRIGDMYGRKVALSITIIGMVCPTMVIGLLPEYFTIGIWSTIILLLCRFTQGIFTAGEYDGSAIYVIEHLGERFQSTASAITRCTAVLGLLFASGAVHFFSAPIFPEWGWRIPFLLSVPLALITFYYRQKFNETPAFQKAKSNEITSKSLCSLIKQQWRPIVRVICLTGGVGVTYQIAVMFMPRYLVMVLPQTAHIMPAFSVWLVLCFGIIMPMVGLIADRLGNLAVVRVSLLGTILASVSLIFAIKHQSVNLALAASLMLAGCVSPFSALTHGMIVEAFPVTQRYRAVSLAHAIGSMFMSGSTNYICLSSMRLFNIRLFPIIYLSSFALLFYYMARSFTFKTNAIDAI